MPPEPSVSLHAGGVVSSYPGVRAHVRREWRGKSGSSGARKRGREGVGPWIYLEETGARLYLCEKLTPEAHSKPQAETGFLAYRFEGRKKTPRTGNLVWHLICKGGRMQELLLAEYVIRHISLLLAALTKLVQN